MRTICGMCEPLANSPEPVEWKLCERHTTFALYCVGTQIIPPTCRLHPGHYGSHDLQPWVGATGICGASEEGKE